MSVLISQLDDNGGGPSIDKNTKALVKEIELSGLFMIKEQELERPVSQLEMPTRDISG